MDIQQVRKGLRELGEIMLAAGESRFGKLTGEQKEIAKDLETLIPKAVEENHWFTENNTRYAMLAHAHMLLKAEKPDFFSEENTGNTIAVIPPALAPLDGLKDVAIALLSGFKVKYRLMFAKEKLMPAIADALFRINPEFSEKLETVEGKISNFDKVIVSIPEDRQEQWVKYFSKYPGKMRRASYGAAVITGSETLNQLESIGSDIFRYFGRTYHNIYKLYLPENYSIKMLTEPFDPFAAEMKQHTQYSNNFEYNKSIYLINSEENTDNGFLIFRKDTSLQSRIAVINFDYYKDEDELKEMLRSEHDKNSRITCIKKIDDFYTVDPGEALKPSFSDPDAKDTAVKIKN